MEKKEDPCLKIPKNKMEREKTKSMWEKILSTRHPKILRQSSVDIQKLLTGSLRHNNSCCSLLTNNKEN